MSNFVEVNEFKDGLIHKREHMVKAGTGSYHYHKTSCGKTIHFDDVSGSYDKITCPRCLKDMYEVLRVRMQEILERIEEVTS